MAARARAQDRDFNRRRWLILDKGLDMARSQKGTALGDCLLKWNVREDALHLRRQRLLQRQGDISAGLLEQEKKLFTVRRDQAVREPTLLLERTPTAEQYPDYVNLKQPRYMRPLSTHQSKAPEFSTFSVFQAVKKRKRNLWEEAVKEAVQFRPTLCPCARLNRQDTDKLLMDWVTVNEKQTRALGLRTDNRSAPIKQVRTGTNPLNLPSRLNSRLHHLARDLLDDISMPGGSGDEGSSDAGSVASSGKVAEEAGDEELQRPVFVTQLPQRQPLEPPPPPPPPPPPAHQHHHELAVFETRDDSKKEKQLAQKQQLDSALVSIYEMLDRRRAAGRPRLRNEPHTRITYAHRHQPGGAAGDSLASTSVATASAGQSRVSTATSSMPAAVRGPGSLQEPQRLLPGTTCRTAESIRILMDSRRSTRRT